MTQRAAQETTDWLATTPMGVGCWQWGDSMMWGYGRGYAGEDLKQAFDASLQAGLNFFDTAEVYGLGRSEKFLGEFKRSTSKPVLTATKFFPFPWRWNKPALLGALRASLARLGLKQVDLYQVHWPTPLQPVEVWADALADAVQAGLTRAVGVSNYNPAETRRAYLALRQRDVSLASNQVHYSLLNRQVEHTGLLALCQELGVRLIAYSPIEKGILAGKYSAANPPPGLRGQLYGRQYMRRVEPLIALVRQTAEKRGKTPAQVALNWLMVKGALPIPGAKNAEQLRQNAGALGWKLTRDEMAALDKVSEAVSPAKK